MTSMTMVQSLELDKDEVKLGGQNVMRQVVTCCSGKQLSKMKANGDQRLVRPVLFALVLYYCFCSTNGFCQCISSNYQFKTNDSKLSSSEHSPTANLSQNPIQRTTQLIRVPREQQQQQQQHGKHDNEFEEFDAKLQLDSLEATAATTTTTNSELSTLTRGSNKLVSEKKLLEILNDTRITAPQQRQIQELIFAMDTNETGSRGRRVVFEESVISKSAIEKFQNNMVIEFDGESRSELPIHYWILSNQTTLLILRSANKYYYWTYGQTASAMVIFCMIVVGNLSILHRLESFRRRRSNVNYFIAQLAIADLLVGIFSVTLDSLLRIQRAFPYGILACRASKYIAVLFIYSSTNLLVALSIDRWEAVVKPLAFTRNRSRGHHLVAAAWILAFIFALPVTFFTIIKEVDGIPQCWIDLGNTGWRTYLIYLTFLLLILPAAIIAICYTHIVYTIWSKAKLVDRQQRQRTTNHQRHREASAEHRRLVREQSSDKQQPLALVGDKVGSLVMKTTTTTISNTREQGSGASVCNLEPNSRRGGNNKTAHRASKSGKSRNENRIIQEFDGKGDKNNFNGYWSMQQVTRTTSATTDDGDDGGRGLGGLGGLNETVNGIQLGRELVGLSNSDDQADLRLSLSNEQCLDRDKRVDTAGDLNSIGLQQLDNKETTEEGGNQIVETDCADEDILSSLSTASSIESSLSPDVELEAEVTTGRATSLSSSSSATIANKQIKSTCKNSNKGIMKQDYKSSPPAALSGLDNNDELQDRLAAQKQKASFVVLEFSKQKAKKTNFLEQENHRRRRSSGGHNNSNNNTNEINNNSNSMRTTQRAAGLSNSALERIAQRERDQDPGVTQQHGSGVIPKARIKTIKMTLVIVVAYILCWSPFLILNLLNVFGYFAEDSTLKQAIMTLSQSLAHLNSAVNPIIFWLFSSRKNQAPSNRALNRGAQKRSSDGRRQLASSTSRNQQSTSMKSVSDRNVCEAASTDQLPVVLGDGGTSHGQQSCRVAGECFKRIFLHKLISFGFGSSPSSAGSISATH